MREVQPIIIYKGVIHLYYIRCNPYRLDLTSSLKKYVFYNLLINNILYLCVT